MVLTGEVTPLLVRCDAVVLGTGVVTWPMWGPAGCFCRVSEVSGVGVAVVLTGGVTVLLVRCDAALVGAGAGTWWIWGPA